MIILDILINLNLIVYRRDIITMKKVEIWLNADQLNINFIIIRQIIIKKFALNMIMNVLILIIS